VPRGRGSPNEENVSTSRPLRRETTRPQSWIEGRHVDNVALAPGLNVFHAAHGIRADSRYAKRALAHARDRAPDCRQSAGTHADEGTSCDSRVERDHHGSREFSAVPRASGQRPAIPLRLTGLRDSRAGDAVGVVTNQGTRLTAVRVWERQLLERTQDDEPAVSRCSSRIEIDLRVQIVMQFSQPERCSPLSPVLLRPSIKADPSAARRRCQGRRSR
jgi:hypothetical protein